MALFCPHSTSRTSSPSLKTGLTRSSFCSEVKLWLEDVDVFEDIALGLTDALPLLDGGVLALLLLVLLLPGLQAVLGLPPADDGEL